MKVLVILSATEGPLLRELELNARSIERFIAENTDSEFFDEESTDGGPYEPVGPDDQADAIREYLSEGSWFVYPQDRGLGNSRSDPTAAWPAVLESLTDNPYITFHEADFQSNYPSLIIVRIDELWDESHGL